MNRTYYSVLNEDFCQSIDIIEFKGCILETNIIECMPLEIVQKYVILDDVEDAHTILVFKIYSYIVSRIYFSQNYYDYIGVRLLSSVEEKILKLVPIELRIRFGEIRENILKSLFYYKGRKRTNAEKKASKGFIREIKEKILGGSVTICDNKSFYLLDEKFQVTHSGEALELGNIVKEGDKYKWTWIFEKRIRAVKTNDKELTSFLYSNTEILITLNTLDTLLKKFCKFFDYDDYVHHTNGRRSESRVNVLKNVALYTDKEQRIEDKLSRPVRDVFTKITSEKTCTNCLKVSFKIYTCSKCKKAHYCSKECQKSNWSTHKLKCVEETFEELD